VGIGKEESSQYGLGLGGAWPHGRFLQRLRYAETIERNSFSQSSATTTDQQEGSRWAGPHGRKHNQETKKERRKLREGHVRNQTKTGEESEAKKETILNVSRSD
jgi:hypothetical protein